MTDSRYRAFVWRWLHLQAESEKWDAETIAKLNSEFDQEVAERPIPFPGGPSFVQITLDHLDEVEAKYNEGHGRALMHAIYTCLSLTLPMPEWVQDGFIDGFEKLKAHKAKTLDEAFGTGLPKNAKFTARQRRTKYAKRVYVEVSNRASQGEGIGDTLFASIGKDLGLSGSSVRDYYYYIKNKYPDMLLNHMVASWNEGSKNLTE